MDKNQEKFLLTLNIKREDVNALVFYKQDGNRFEMEKTIKMKVETPYEMILTFRPAQKIKSACFKGEHLGLEDEETNDECSKHTLRWNSSDIGLTKKNKRERFPLILDIQNAGTLELTLQFKFYGVTDTNHSAWGKCLHQIDYNCVHRAGSSFVQIQSEIYR